MRRSFRFIRYRIERYRGSRCRARHATMCSATFFWWAPGRICHLAGFPPLSPGFTNLGCAVTPCFETTDCPIVLRYRRRQCGGPISRRVSIVILPNRPPSKRAALYLAYKSARPVKTLSHDAAKIVGHRQRELRCCQAVPSAGGGRAMPQCCPINKVDRAAPAPQQRLRRHLEPCSKSVDARAGPHLRSEVL